MQFNVSKTSNKLELLGGGGLTRSFRPNWCPSLFDWFFPRFIDYVAFNECVARIDGDVLEVLRETPHLATLNLRRNIVSDKSLEGLQHVRHLRNLDLGETSISDDGIRHVVNLPKLQFLYVDSTKITDCAIKYLEEMEELHTLRVDHTSVTANGLLRLRKRTQLQFLGILGVKSSPVAIQRLQDALPNCRIAHD